MKQLIILIFIAGLPWFCSAQVSTIQLEIHNGLLNKPIKSSNVKVILNDTMVRHLITNEKGITGFLEVPDGTYNLSILVESYKDYYIKNVKAVGSAGKHLKIKLNKA
ncbi:MAG: hypothetical protein JWO32_608 [Bacteroidetes bacterium]|nr:hypothetical protein [Bacteroidota bacterium]